MVTCMKGGGLWQSATTAALRCVRILLLGRAGRIRKSHVAGPPESANTWPSVVDSAALAPVASTRMKPMFTDRHKPCFWLKNQNNSDGFERIALRERAAAPDFVPPDAAARSGDVDGNCASRFEEYLCPVRRESASIGHRSDPYPPCCAKKIPLAEHLDGNGRADGAICQHSPALDRPENFFSHLGLPMFIADARGKVLSANEALASMLETTSAQLLGTSIFSHVYPEDSSLDRMLFVDVVKRVRDAYTLEERYISSTGRHVWVSVRVALGSSSLAETCVIGVVTDISGLKGRERVIHFRANMDSLTGIPRRAFFLEMLKERMEAYAKSQNPLCLLFVDLDKFKLINDTHGHHAGDQALVHAVRAMRRCVRESDLIGRFGGDEFLVLLSNVTNETLVHRIADKLLEYIRQPLIVGETSLSLSASIGIARYHGEAIDAMTFVRQADAAMYAVKHVKPESCLRLVANEA